MFTRKQRVQSLFWIQKGHNFSKNGCKKFENALASLNDVTKMFKYLISDLKLEIQFRKVNKPIFSRKQ